MLMNDPFEPAITICFTLFQSGIFCLPRMIGHQFAPSVAPVRPVKEVQFGILSPEEIVGIYGRVIAEY